MQDYIHLHVHTQYSILDGQSSVKNLINKALNDGMLGMAITDHGNMMAIKEFYNLFKSAQKKNQTDLQEVQEQLQNLEKGDTEVLSKYPDIPKNELLPHLNKEIERLTRRCQFKPIFGCEMYVARRGHQSKTEKIDQSGNHLIVLAKNEKGYHNLIKLVSKSWVDGFYMKPRTDHEELEKYKEGLIISSACIAGEVPSKILKNDIEGAEKAILWYKKTFGDDYYLELQRHQVTDPTIMANRETFPLQEKANEVIIQLARKHQIKLICTNDCHFVNEENAEAHDRLICLSTGARLDDPNRLLYSKQEWFKTRAEMNQVFADIPEALSNTIEIWQKTELYSIDHAPIMPNFDIPSSFGTEEAYRKQLTEEDLFKEFTRDENGNVIMSDEEGIKKIEKLGGYDKLYRIKFEADYLAKITYEGAKKRYGDPLSDEVKERLKFELHIMKTMGFPGYFLIVQDYINAARNELNVSVGPGRGSAAGSCVAYCLGITQIDPIKYDLLFERFLNPDRISLPDIDIDFDDAGRGRVLDWVTQKYGEDNCAHIITYGTMATKSALKDVARVEQIPFEESKQLCKLIPDQLPEIDGKSPKMTLENCLATLPELRAKATSPDIRLQNTFKYAQMLEGNVRNTGVHACGFIICKDKISDWVPVSTADDKATGQKLHCTQYEGKVIEETGLIKMDFLGLKTLTIIKSTIEAIKESLGIDVDIDNIPTDDQATFDLFSSGNTIGTFQFESPGMQKYLRELEPNCLGDLIAMNALYRPGPIAYIPSFIKRKKGIEQITYDLPCMEKYLKDTYGITVYQEQVMLLSREIAGFTRGESDTLRKAMGKKLIDKLNHMYPKFIAGGKANGYPENKLEKIWNDWRAFASYAFNKSHAACYAWIAYQTGYLKAHFPAQFMAGDMNSWVNDITTISKLMDECKGMGISTLGPDVNESRKDFSVNSTGDIRFGLVAIKGVGDGAITSLVEEREKNGPFKDIYDFFERCDQSVCNKKSLESLALSGAFDNLGIEREQFFELLPSGDTMLDVLSRYGQQYRMDQQTAQNSLFGDTFTVEIEKPKFPQNFERWSNTHKLKLERELIGIYLSAHPLDEFKVIVKDVCTNNVGDLSQLENFGGKNITLAGIVTNIRQGQTKRGLPYGIVTIEDYESSGELKFFGDNWARNQGYFQEDLAIFVSGRVEARRYQPEQFDFNVNDIKFLADIKDDIIKSITIYARLDFLNDKTVAELITMLKETTGPTELHIQVIDPETRIKVRLNSRTSRISVTSKLIDYINSEEALQYKIN